MAQKFNKQVLKVVVGQICQTIGWNGINNSALEILIDVLNRYFLEIARTTHQFTDLFGRTQPNLDDLGLAFAEMGINIKELQEYVEFVDSAPCALAVPKFPVAKESHLNFLKPGSQEVMTRPVHVNEHLPPTLELSIDTSHDLTNSPQPSPTFKRPGDPVDAGPTKRARLGLEEEGRPLREISSVMMTTGGFISPAREGKLPESKMALPASDFRSASPPLYPTVPPEVNREKKKKPPEVKEKRKEKRAHPPPEQGVKKLVGMKEVAKLKAFKSKNSSPTPKNVPAKPASPVLNPEKTLIQKLSESPHLVITPVPAQLPPPPTPVVKLATEPDKQKLNIFKKITKVKEEEPITVVKEEPAFSSPGSPSTPKTPDILRSPEHKKKKKDKEKRKKHKDGEKSEKSKHGDADRRPKTPDVPISFTPPSFSFFPPGVRPPLISNPLIPRFPGILGPNFPNIPPLPQSFLQPPKPDVTIEPVPSPSAVKSPLAILLNEKKEKEHKKEKKEKKKKKDKDKDKDKPKSKDKLKEVKDKDKEPREKPKKEKKEKKHSEERHKEHKSKDKKVKKEKRREKEKEKEREKEKEKEREKEKEKIKEEVIVAVPKLTLKIGTPGGSRPSSPKRAEEERKPPKVEERPPKKEKEKEKPPESGDIARISALFSKTPKPEQKPLTIQTESLKTPKDDNPLQKSPGTIIDKDGNKVWICPSCGRPDDGTPMIGCDECDAWYHWVCVGIQVPPDDQENWYCRFCIVKKQGSSHSSKKKKGRKKRPGHE